nr:thioesterase family protein [Microbacterium sp. ZXX196]
MWGAHNSPRPSGPKPVASPVVNVLWRTILVLFRARRRHRRGDTLAYDDIGRIRLTTLPTDIDLLRHMNNGRYLSLFDLGRWDFTTRTGLSDVFRDNGWYAVVANETISFRRSLQLWQRFELETRWLGYDDRALFLEHRAIVGSEIAARAVIRARILRRGGGSVTHDELFSAMGISGGFPEVPAWVHDWAAAASLPSTRQSAPRDWQDTPRRG